MSNPRYQKVAKELQPIIEHIMTVAGELDTSDIATTRELHDSFIKAGLANLPAATDIVETRHSDLGFAENPDLKVIEYTPVDAKPNRPALVWIHGGGLIFGFAEQDVVIMRELSRRLGCSCFSVEYRVAPEHPYPAASNDCYEALKWVHSHSEQLGLNPNKIAVGGTSAGGGLAASTAIRARDEGRVPLCYQLLMYPMLDDTNVATPEGEGPEHLMWTAVHNRDGWNAYLGEARGSANVGAYAAPHRLESFEGLPPAMIICGDIDLFLNENLTYGQKLIKAGVQTNMRIYGGAYHGYVLSSIDSQLAVQTLDAYAYGLSTAFAD